MTKYNWITIRANRYYYCTIYYTVNKSVFILFNEGCQVQIWILILEKFEGFYFMKIFKKIIILLLR